MYSSNDDDGDASSETQIQIYTDSKDKVPELDPSKDNPFYEQPHQTVVPPEPRKSSASKKRKADRRVDGDIEIREAFTREEGLVYVL